jgi:signal transduction histidine kinase
VLDVEVSVNIQVDHGEDRLATFVRDITDRKRTEAKLKQDLVDLREADLERTRLLRHLVSAQEEERKRIAIDIHDDPVQKIVAVDLRLATLESHIRTPEAHETFDRLHATVRSAIRSLRTMLFDLQPASLGESGLVAAVTEYVDRLGLLDDLRAEVIDHGTSSTSSATNLIAYRLIQEAVSNAGKHAHARHLTVELETDDEVLRAQIRDDGVGFDADGIVDIEPGHLGLTSIRERAELAGGDITISSRPGEGTTVAFTLPLALGSLDAD